MSHSDVLTMMLSKERIMLLEIMETTMLFGLIVIAMLTLVLIAVGLFTVATLAYRKLRGELE